MIPNLCRLPIVLASIVAVELMLIVYVLSLGRLSSFDWSYFSLLSFYVQWIVLLGLVCICRLRRRINAMRPVSATLTCLFVAALVTIVVNTACQKLGIYQSNLGSPYAVHWAARDVLIALALTAVLLRYGYLQQRWRDEQVAGDSARYEALQSRIQPHFLFNTMNTIASLISIDQERAEQAIEDLSSLLRQQIDIDQQFYNWQSELTLCEAYLRIESLRYGDRLAVIWDVDDIPANLQLPPLIMQPLLENAIKHGIAQLTEKGFVKVTGKLDSSGKRNAPQSVSIVVENSVPTDFLPYASGDTLASGEHGIALANVRSRVASLYRDSETGVEHASADFELLSGLCRVTLRLPNLAYSPKVAKV